MLGLPDSNIFPASPDVRPALQGGLCHFWVFDSPERLRVRLGQPTRITQDDALSSDSRRAIRDSTLKALPVVILTAHRAMREALPLALFGVFLQGNLQRGRGGSCYAANTVQPGTAMTVKEIGSASATGLAFSISDALLLVRCYFRECRITSNMLNGWNHCETSTFRSGLAGRAATNQAFSDSTSYAPALASVCSIILSQGQRA